MKFITRERLTAVLSYDAETGIFCWRARTGPRSVVGAEAGFIAERGYRRIHVDKRTYMAHVLAWFYVTGEWPSLDIDHINGDTGDNRWANLRQATKSENLRNQRPHKNNTSGFRGVMFFKPQGRWTARIGANGKKYFLGYFDTPEAAYAAYYEAAQKLHGAFASAPVPPSPGP